ncbi:MAG: adenylate/guanylate cyclase domain-containing protein [Spirochaetia bacterium]
MSDVAPPTDSLGTRKLTAILSTDVHGYARLMSSDEEDTVKRLSAFREIIFRLIRENRGRVANTAGDAVLAEFASAKDSVNGAIQIQKVLGEQNAPVSPECQMHFRIGVNLGDVYEQQGDLFGDGVNIAARIQALADPGGILISSSVYEQLERKSDIQVEFAGEQQLKNIEKPVRVYRVVTKTAPTLVIATPSRLREVEEELVPSIVVGVLPFDNASNDPEQGYFCDGLTEDLTTALANTALATTAILRIKVVSRNLMFGFKGKTPDVRQLGHDLGATHIIEGSVRKAGNKLRINAQLLETKNGSHLWAQRYDKELTDLFEIQDDIVRSIVTELDVQFVGGQQMRVLRAGTNNTEAYDLFRRAFGVANVSSPQTFDRVVGLLDEAIQLDSGFSAAYAFKAVVLLMKVRNKMATDRNETIRQARLALERALQLNKRSALGHSALGMFHHYYKQFEQAQKEFELAVSLDPNSATVYGAYGWFCLQTKNYDKALYCARQANALSPVPLLINFELEALSLQFLGRLEEALAITSRELRQQPKDLLLLVAHAGIAAQLGLTEEVASARSKVLEIQPDFNSVRYATDIGMLDSETAAQYAEMLHKAGLP